jgi:hypothetical protein
MLSAISVLSNCAITNGLFLEQRISLSLQSDDNLSLLEAPLADFPLVRDL